MGWNFKERAEIAIEKTSSLDEDNLLAVAVDAGADDLDTSGEDSVVVIAEPSKLEPVRDALAKAGYKVQSADVSMAPLSTVEVTSADAAKQLLRLLDTLEGHEDVQSVYANYDMDAKWMQEFLS